MLGQNTNSHSYHSISYEALIIDKKLRELIHNNASREKFISHLQENHFQTLFDHALLQAQEAQISLSQALLFSPSNL